MSSSKQRLGLPLALFAIFLMGAEWILLVAGPRPHEMIVGTGAIVLSSLFLYAVHQSSTLQLEFTLADVAFGWRIPWYVARGCGQIAGVLFRDLFTTRRAESLYRVSGFKTSKDDPRLVARRVLATIYTTASPNSIVIGIDFTQSRLLVHQIERAPLSTMTKRLGASS